jgi:hypothetical protein
MHCVVAPPTASLQASRRRANPILTVLCLSLEDGKQLLDHLPPCGKPVRILPLSQPTGSSVRPVLAALCLAIMAFPVLSVGAPAGQRRPSLMAYLQAPEADVIDRFGQPTAAEQLSNGDTAIRVVSIRDRRRLHRQQRRADVSDRLDGWLAYSGSPLGTTRRYVPAEMVKLACDARFTVGPDKLVRGIYWEGEGCFDN